MFFVTKGMLFLDGAIVALLYSVSEMLGLCDDPKRLDDV
jgi:hypothetical protein